MAKGYFNPNIEQKCEYCFYGSINKTGDKILCEKSGILPIDYKCCKKWTYDPFKRVPKGVIEKNEKYKDAIKQKEKEQESTAQKYGVKREKWEL